MTKQITRIFAGLAAIAVIAAAVLCKLPAMTADAAQTPVFTLTSSVASAKTGDIVTVSLYVDNETETALSSFDGDITFNSSHFSYIDFSCPEEMQKKLTCLDFDATASSKISITFADTTKSLIPSGAKQVLLLELRFSVISPVTGSGQVLCKIDNCYSGMTSYGELPPAQLVLPVQPTESTASSTTTTTTTTKQRSSDALLRSLSVAPGVLTPAFNPEFVAYSVSVEFEVATIRISATPNSSTAVASGIGVKDLAVGANTFTVTVTAEDGSTRQYGIVVYRAADTPTTAPTTTTTASAAPDVSTITGYPESTTLPLPSTSQPDKVIEGGSQTTPSDTELVKIIGIIFAEVALFMFGFLAGFFLDKNMRKKAVAESTYGPLDRPPVRREPYMPQPDYHERGDYAEYPDYGAPPPIYPDYGTPQPIYPDYGTTPAPPPPPYPDYSAQPQYPDYPPAPPEYSEPAGEYETYAQYGGSPYDGQRFDEYGNPVLDSAPYSDQQWDGYGGPNNDTYYQ